MTVRQLNKKYSRLLDTREELRRNPNWLLFGHPDKNIDPEYMRMRKKYWLSLDAFKRDLKEFGYSDDVICALLHYAKL